MVVHRSEGSPERAYPGLLLETQRRYLVDGPILLIPMTPCTFSIPL